MKQSHQSFCNKLQKKTTLSCCFSNESVLVFLNKMNNYKKYKKPISIDFDSEKLLYLFVFPLLMICLVSYLSLLFMGLPFTCVFYSIATVFLNFHIHGIKNFTQNKRKLKPAIVAIPSVVVLFMFVCTYLLLLAIIAFISIGVYQLVLYKKTNDFNTILFTFWSFCIIGLPVLYGLFLLGKHYFFKWKISKDYLDLVLNIKQDPELPCQIDSIQFVNTARGTTSDIKIEKSTSFYSEGKLNKAETSEVRKKFMEEHFFSNVHFPIDANLLLLSWHSIAESKYYNIVLPFSTEKMNVFYKKHPRNRFCFLLEKTTDIHYLQILPNGKITFFSNSKVLIDHEDCPPIPNEEREKNNTQETQKLYKEAWAFTRKKQYDLAQERCDAIITICPSYGYVYFLKLRLLWHTEGFDACFENKDYYIEKAKHESGALAHIYNNYGCLLDSELRYDEAQLYFEKAVQTCPKEGIYLSNLAEIHYKLNNHNEAVRFANEAIEKQYTSSITNEIIENEGKINEINFLQLELAQLASAYRSETKKSNKEQLILEQYYNRFNKIVKLNNGFIELAPDAELPNNLMPNEYVAFWLKKNHIL